jgi:tetratricopeptide (TPR) repeat protein
MDPGVWRLPSRALAVGLLLAAGSMWQAFAPAPAEAAQFDLSYFSNSTWTADPLDGRVHVVTVVTATSNTVDAGGRRYYYDRIQLTLPAFSTGFQALSVFNRPLPTTVESASTSGVIVVVGLGERLYSGASATFSLKFDLVDSGGATDRDFRIGQKLMSFPVSAFGSPGTPGSTVTVVFPAAFTVQEELGNLTREVYGSGEVVFSSGIIDDSTQLSAWFTAVQPVPPSDFRVRTVSIGPLYVTLRYWVDDVGWADEVERVLRAGYPMLSEMIGLGGPVGTTLTVEEASGQDLGFSGSYDLASGQVRISYFADPYVILHEMAHMWFNSDLVADRWIQEGFASYYAQQAVGRLGLPDHAPVLTDRIRQAATPLNDWVVAGQPNSPKEAYLYAASLEAVREIAAQAGADGLRQVWAWARSWKAAYQPLHAPQTELLVDRTTDWRRLLDLLEQCTGRSYAYIWQRWVVDPSQVSQLQQRTTSLSAYTGAQTVAGSWDLPPEIRRALDDWQFVQATGFIAQARGILSERDQIAVEAAKEQTAPPPALRVAFERSGLIVATSEAGTELDVLDQLAAARQARTDRGGAARAVGLIGIDPDADLAAARDAFSKGDLSRAMSLATSARGAWQRADNTGQVRIFGSLSVLAGLLLLLGLTLWRRSDRRRVLPAPAAAGAAHQVAGVAGATEGTIAEPRRRKGTEMPVAVAAIRDETTNGHGGAGDERGHNGRSHPEDDGHPDAGPAESGSAPEESAYDLLQRGTALLHDRHNAQAAVILERASRLEQSKGSILEALGRAYYNSGQHARAAETFEALLEVDPSAHYGHFALGLSLARLGRAQEAKTHLRLAVALNPASETYRRALEKMEAIGP